MPLTTHRISLICNKLEFKPSSESHNIIGVHSLLDRFQFPDITSIHLLQWRSRNRIIGIAGSDVNRLIDCGIMDPLCSFFHKCVHCRVGFGVSPRGVYRERRECNRAIGGISAGNLRVGEDVGKEWFDRVSVQNTVFHGVGGI